MSRQIQRQAVSQVDRQTDRETDTRTGHGGFVPSSPLKDEIKLPRLNPSVISIRVRDK